MISNLCLQYKPPFFIFRLSNSVSHIILILFVTLGWPINITSKRDLMRIEYGKYSCILPGNLPYNNLYNERYTDTYNVSINMNQPCTFTYFNYTVDVAEQTFDLNGH